MKDFRKLPFMDEGDLRETSPLGIAAAPPEAKSVAIDELLYSKRKTRRIFDTKH